MLNFFRKYQKFFFVIITVVIVFSFSFFGTYSAIFNQEAKREDKVIGKTVDKTSLKESELYAMSLFLSTDASRSYGRHVYPNFLNDGVIAKDFIETNLMHLLLEENFEALRPDLEERWEKMKRFQPYKHPDAPFLSAMAVWSRFAPELFENLQKIQEQKEFSLESFELMANLYLEQAKFSPEMLRNVLVYQQKQYPNVPVDQRLYHDDLMLFGFYSAADWFSQKFIDLCSQFIINASILAEQKGYQVQNVEAKLDMFRTLQTLLEKEKVDKPAQEIYRKQLQVLGMDEETVIQSWRRVMLFRKRFLGHAQSILLDPATFEDFESFASMTMDVKRYQMKESLHLATLEDLFSLELYLDAISDRSGLEMPQTFYSIDRVQNDHPKFVCKTYKLEVGVTDLERASMQVPVKRMWDFQMSDEHWQALHEKFPEISAKNLTSRSERLRFLDDLSPELRGKIDAFSRKEIVKKQPEILLEELKSAKTRFLSLDVSADHDFSRLFIKNKDHFVDLISKAPLKGMESANADEKRARDELAAYSEDEHRYFTIQVVSRGEKPRILTFEEAKETGFLSKAYDAYLRKHYETVRAKSPKVFQNENGEWKPFHTVKDEIAKSLFSQTLKQMDLGKKAEDSYLEHRFVPYLKIALLDITKKKNESSYVMESQNPLLDQFRLVETEDTVLRTSNNSNIFDLEKGEFSPVHVDNEKPSFFQILDKKTEDSGALAIAKKELEDEVRLELAKNLLSEMQDVLIFSRGS